MKLIERVGFFLNGFSAVSSVREGHTIWALFSAVVMVILGIMIMLVYKIRSLMSLIVPIH